MTRQSSLRIETPEGVVFSFQLASPVARTLAWALDAAIVLLASSTVGKIAGLAGFLNADLARALGAVLYFVFSIGYGIAFEWRWRGQTVGKRLFHLRVVDAQGLRLQFTQVLFRNLLRPVDMLPVFNLVGGVACFLSRYGQRLGDLAANTVVLRESKPAEPDVEEIAPVKYNSLLAYPHLAARLRRRVDAEAVGIAVAALSRRDGYEPSARVELFAELAAYFRAPVEFPESAVEGLTDEQYVRSAIRAVVGQAQNMTAA
jgi:uncharacterized RDD family membrane protein YckC